MEAELAADLLGVLGGLVLLVAGGEGLVRGAVALARRLGVSPVVIGLTVVAIGTSMPELTVAVDAALRGAPDIAVGSVVGSNVSNILLVLGVTALIHPVACAPRMIFRDGLFLLAVSFSLAVLAATGQLLPVQGVAMVSLLAAYVAYSYWAEAVRHAPSAELRAAEVRELGDLPPKLVFAVPAVVLGVAGVIAGADLLVTGATGIARAAGVSEAVIGLSLVAVGTSLPELATSALAAWRGHTGVAVGNIVGSNISNILLILGVTATLGGVPVADQIAAFDVWVMVAATAVLMPVMISGMQISRREGLTFVAAYALYIAALYGGAPQAVMDTLGG